MLVFVTTKPKCSQKNKTHRTEHGTNSTRTSTEEKTKKKNTGARKKQSNEQQAAKERSKSRKEKQFHKRSTAHNKVQEKKQGENKEKTKNVEIQIRTKCMSEKDTSIRQENDFSKIENELVCASYDRNFEQSRAKSSRRDSTALEKQQQSSQ
jgi:hypothetical protein